MIASLDVPARRVDSPSSRRKPGPTVLFGRKIKMDPGFRRDDGRSGFLRMLGIVLMAGLLVSTLARAVDPLPFKDRAQELRFQALAKQLRCLVCQNESLADSNAPLAADLRRDVFQQMQAGKSDEEIKAWLTSRYSDFVLYDPPLHASTSLLWFGPFIALIAGGAAIFVIVRRRAATATATTPPAAPEDDW